MNISIVATGRSQHGWEQFPPPSNAKKNYKYFDRSFRKVLNVIGNNSPPPPASNAKKL